MIKRFNSKKVNLLRVVVNLGVLLGSIALTKGCVFGMYEPTKPDILKSKD